MGEASEQRTMGIFEYNEEPSFLDRMHNDQMSRNETCQLNDLKREAKNVPAREARRINKMVENYEKTKPKRGVTPKPDLDKKPTAPKQDPGEGQVPGPVGPAGLVRLHDTDDRGTVD